MREIVIASAVRTPVGKFLGSFSNVSAVELGTIAVKEALKRANIKPDQVDETYFGCVIQSALLPNVARQVSINAGIPVDKPALTINILLSEESVKYYPRHIYGKIHFINRISDKIGR